MNVKRIYIIKHWHVQLYYNHLVTFGLNYIGFRLNVMASWKKKMYYSLKLFFSEELVYQ